MTGRAIVVENVGKKYRLGQRQPHRELMNWFLRFRPKSKSLVELDKGRDLDSGGRQDYIWALRNINFALERGEILGVIGRNGAGKSTLLKLMSRLTEPTEGRIVIRGRVGSLLEVGTGFNEELTGRENVYVNGALLGMKKREIDERYDEIVDFSGIGDFIDTPVKRYSSGMSVRLGFAVAAHFEPEVLLVDEVLAVGDAEFQRKCLKKVGETAYQGRTVLFVSHNMESIGHLCTRAIWLHGGRLMIDAEPSTAIEKYLSHAADVPSRESDISSRGDRIGNGAMRFTDLSIRNNSGEKVDAVGPGASLDIVLSYRSAFDELRHVSILMGLVDQFDRELMRFWTTLVNQDFERLPGTGRIICHIPRLPLKPGTYSISVESRVAGAKADRLENAFLLEVGTGDFFRSGRSLEQAGVVLCEHEWRAVS